jgi:hypothetical protein
MYRDSRGTLYHPHIQQDIPIGTLAVEEYSRPEWTFNKVLYIEKEGFFEALKAARWPERHDCALLTSKGYSSRAVRDLLDGLADGEEPVTVFCVHDADIFGTTIYQSLQEATKARPRRRVEVANLGLEPWEALAMGLAPERLEEKKRETAPADYVLERPDGEKWAEWLQTNRVELNEMTTPQFIAWLDGKMEEHDGRKVIPPEPVIASEMAQQLASHVRQAVSERILRDAGVDEQVNRALSEIAAPEPADVAKRVAQYLDEKDDGYWRDYVRRLAAGLVRR